MEHYFNVNSIKKREMVKKWRRGHIRWKFGFPVLLIASIICVGISIAVFIYVSLNSDVELWISLMAAFIFLMIPGIIIQALWLRLFRTTEDPFNTCGNEVVVICDDGFQNIFHRTSDKNEDSAVALQIPYENIIRLSVNDYYDVLWVRGLYEQLDYSNYAKGAVYERFDNREEDPEKLAMCVMLYFDNSDKMLELLEQKSGLTIEHYSDPEEVNEK
jgi:hypothetical protein